MAGGRATKQKMVLGTHTSEGEQNYLMLAEVQLPTQDAETEANGYDEERGEVGGYGAAAGKVQVPPCDATSRKHEQQIADFQPQEGRWAHEGFRQLEEQYIITDVCEPVVPIVLMLMGIDCLSKAWMCTR